MLYFIQNNLVKQKVSYYFHFSLNVPYFNFNISCCNKIIHKNKQVAFLNPTFSSTSTISASLRSESSCSSRQKTSEATEKGTASTKTSPCRLRQTIRKRKGKFNIFFPIHQLFTIFKIVNY